MKLLLNVFNLRSRYCGVLVAMAGWTMRAFAEPNPPVLYHQDPVAEHRILLESGGAIIRAADDFVLTESATIRGLMWWGASQDIPGNGPFTLSIYRDESGRPGAVLNDYGLEPVVERLTGSIAVGYLESQYWAALKVPFEAEAGVRYWLSIARAPDYSWGWEGSSFEGGSTYSVRGGEWVSTQAQAAFALLSIVPEPSGLGLGLTAGLAAWVLKRRRV